jgi:uncharacterized protein
VKKFYLLVILGFSLFGYSCGQDPKVVTKEDMAAVDTTTHIQQIDSAKYIPKPTDWVNDFENLFSKTEIQSLDSLFAACEKKGTVQFGLATIDSAMMGPIDFESYSLLMFRTWGVGSKEKNNGILFVISRDMRRLRIQNGYGIEKKLTNDQTKEIIDLAITPYFKKGKFYQGIKEGVLEINRKLNL